MIINNMIFRKMGTEYGRRNKRDGSNTLQLNDECIIIVLQVRRRS